MTSPLIPVLTFGAVLGSLLLLRAGLARSRGDRIATLIAAVGRSAGGPGAAIGIRLPVRGRRLLAAAGLGAAGVVLGGVAPPFGPILLGVGGAALPFLMSRRLARRRAAALEERLADAAETTALAVRSGLSVPQALEFAAEEVEPPLREYLGAVVADRRIGISFEDSIRRFAESVGTEDARLLALILTMHARTGGNLVGALDEVRATIRHRLVVRRELRALSAQGRMSGAILGCLPLAFFFLMSFISQEDLEPVYRSGAGMAMVGAGLTMQAVAYLWIRRLLRVEV